jgi:hypothetical protein
MSNNLISEFLEKISSYYSSNIHHLEKRSMKKHDHIHPKYNGFIYNKKLYNNFHNYFIY